MPPPPAAAMPRDWVHVGPPWISRIRNPAALRWDPADAFRAGASPEGLLQGARGGVVPASARWMNLNRGQLNPPGGGGAIYDSSRQCPGRGGVGVGRSGGPIGGS